MKRDLRCFQPQKLVLIQLNLGFSFYHFHDRNDTSVCSQIAQLQLGSKQERPFEIIGITLIEDDHLGDWSPEKDCCWQLMFRQPVRKPSSASSEDGLSKCCLNVSHHQQQSLRISVSQMIIFNQGMLLLGSNQSLNAPLLRTQIRMTRHASSARAKY